MPLRGDLSGDSTSYHDTLLVQIGEIPFIGRGQRAGQIHCRSRSQHVLQESDDSVKRLVPVHLGDVDIRLPESDLEDAEYLQDVRQTRRMFFEEALDWTCYEVESRNRAQRWCPLVIRLNCEQGPNQSPMGKGTSPSQMLMRNQLTCTTTD